jgi:hypothetical protein
MRASIIMKRAVPSVLLDADRDVYAISRIEWEKEDIASFNRARDAWRRDRMDGERQFERLADNGSIMSMIHLGLAYSRGNGVPVNFEKAELLLRRAAGRGSNVASGILGMHYRLRKMSTLAKEAYDIGVEKNYTPSIYGLGRMYWRGEGVLHNLSEAFNYWEAAAAFGHVFAIRNVAYAMIFGVYGLDKIPRGLCLWIKYVDYHIKIYRQSPGSELFRVS